MDCFDGWLPLWACMRLNVFSILAYVGTAILGVFTVWLGLFTRLNARMSALPLLHPHREAREILAGRNGEIVARILNGGLGPAIVTKYEVIVNGAPVNLSSRNDVVIVCAALFGLPPQELAVECFTFEGAFAIPKDGTIRPLKLDFGVNTKEEYDAVVDRLCGLRLRIEYESMFGDQLLFDSTVPSIPPKLGLFLIRKRPKT